MTALGPIGRGDDHIKPHIVEGIEISGARFESELGHAVGFHLLSRIKGSDGGLRPGRREKGENRNAGKGQQTKRTGGV